MQPIKHWLLFRNSEFVFYSFVIFSVSPKIFLPVLKKYIYWQIS